MLWAMLVGKYDYWCISEWFVRIVVLFQDWELKLPLTFAFYFFASLKNKNKIQNETKQNGKKRKDKKHEIKCSAYEVFNNCVNPLSLILNWRDSGNDLVIMWSWCWLLTTRLISFSLPNLSLFLTYKPSPNTILEKSLWLILLYMTPVVENQELFQAYGSMHTLRYPKHMRGVFPSLSLKVGIYRSH